MLLLEQKKIKSRLSEIEGWEQIEQEIRRTYKFKDFKQSIAFLVEVAILAEKANHHPDITINWNKVSLALSTHSAGGLTEKDFDLARNINSCL
jgi:4a-hydroxytetrahydrobiopterin dehydratase